MLKSIIILQSIENPDIMEAWGSLTDVCKYHTELPYHQLKVMKFPFTFGQFRFFKIPYKEQLLFSNPFV